MLINGEEIFFLDYAKDKQKCIIYVPLRSYLGLINKEHKKYIQDAENAISVEFCDYMKKKKFIDMREVQKTLNNMPPELSLGITDDCNLRCIYCYASAGEVGKNSEMSCEMINLVIDNYFSYIQDFDIPNGEIPICFMGGGEPTCNFDLLKYSVDVIRKKATLMGLIPRFTLATNGCYGTDIREFLKENFSAISLSFDGPEKIQNTHRPLADGGGSFDIVNETAKYFYGNNVSFAFRATVSNWSVHYLKEVIDFFAENYPNKSLGLEPLNKYGRAIANNQIGPPDKKVFAKEIIKAYKYAEDKPINLINAGLGNFNVLRSVFCSAVGAQSWTVKTNGEIYCCTRDNMPDLFKFGRFDLEKGQVFIDEEKKKRIAEYNVFNYNECKNCFCKYHCAGDCLDLRLSNYHNCKATREIGKYILNRKIDLEQI